MLEKLGVTSDKCEAILFSLIESCLAQELLRIWQRSCHFVNAENDEGKKPLIQKLKSIMQFIKNEVENEQRVLLTTEGFGLVSTDGGLPRNRKQKLYESHHSSTAASLINSKSIFCEVAYASDACFKAQTFTLAEKQNVIKDQIACHRCLKICHRAR